MQRPAGMVAVKLAGPDLDLLDHLAALAATSKSEILRQALRLVDVDKAAQEPRLRAAERAKPPDLEPAA